MRTITILIAAICLVLLGYSNTFTTKEAGQSKATVQQQNHRHGEDEKIELNKGKKWKVDNNMLVHIRQMEQDVVTFSTSAPKDYKGLSDNLKTNINLLTSDCTMKGKAHDELHKWLLPFIELSRKFAAAAEKEEQEKIYQEFKKSFVEFNTYFE